MKNSLKFGVAVDVGETRKGKVNQDFTGILLPGWFNKKQPLLLLSDGMGAYGGGEIASKIAVQTILRVYKHYSRKQVNFTEILDKGIRTAHKEIIRQSKRKKELEWMGCTIVAAVPTESTIHLANVGDSRAYLVNASGINQINYDHSFVAEQVRLGLITELEARTHPKRNVLTLSLSARRDNVQPYFSETQWQENDVLLLCSDGLWGPVTEAQIQAVLLEFEPQQAADKLVKLANISGGPDNISVIIATRRKEPVTLDDADITRPGIA